MPDLTQGSGDAAGGRYGRPPVTSRSELERVGLEMFGERGFDATTVDDIAGAAGIGRRTFFRYFASKNDLVWGEFDRGLHDLEAALAAGNCGLPLGEQLRLGVLGFNRLDPEGEPSHRARISLILGVPALQAHSTLRYAAWREVIARFAAARLGAAAGDLVPQLVGHVCLAAALTAYEQWLRQPGSSLHDLLDEALLRAFDPSWAQA